MFIRLSTVWALLSVCRLDIFNLSGMLNCGSVTRDYCQDELSLLAAMFFFNTPRDPLSITRSLGALWAPTSDWWPFGPA